VAFLTIFAEAPLAVGGGGGHGVRLARRRGAVGADLRLAAGDPLAAVPIARDLLLPVLWARAWMVESYESRGNAVDVGPIARAPATVHLRFSRLR